MSGPSPLLRLYPVVVGINQYLASRDGQSYDLQFAMRDAERMTAFLRLANPAFESIPFTPFLNEEATAERIRHELRMRWASYRLGPGDVLFFYFAGHGLVTPDGRAYLCCYDTNFRDPNSGGLRLDDLYNDMQQVSAQTVFVVLDACYSGAIVDPGVINQNASQQLRAVLSQTLPQSTGNRIVLAAAHPTQKARENAYLEGGSGIFTNSILHGWREGDARRADGVITPQSLSDYLQRQFAGYEDQQPVIVVSGGNLLTIGRFDPLVQGVAPVTTPLPPRADLFDPTKSRTPVAPIRKIPKLSLEGKRHLYLVAGGLVLLSLLLCGVLEFTSTQVFLLTYIAAFIVAFVAIPLAARIHPGLATLALVVALIQCVLLAGVAHLRFSLGIGVGALDALAQYAWLAVVIFLGHVVLMLYTVADGVLSS